MQFRSLIKPFRSSSTVPIDLPDVSHLDIPNQISQTKDVLEQECLVHLYLLESFVSTKEAVEKWALAKSIAPEVIWRFYINVAVKRMVEWFQATYWVNLNSLIPPLDVLMVWHALLQHPEDWKEFIDHALVDFEQWDTKALLKVFTNSPHGGFQVPLGSRDFVNDLYETPNLLNAIDISADFLVESNLNHTTGRFRMFTQKHETIKICTAESVFQFRFDFYAAVNDQLLFANRVLEYSWHRMYPGRDTDGGQFQGAIRRYDKFLSLLRFQPRMQCLEPLVHHPPLKFVPALDIDFVWRTHLLSARGYRWHTIGFLERLFPHTPSPLQHEPGPDYETSSRLYQHVFGEEYDICLCWYCVMERDLEDLNPKMLKSQIRNEKDRREADSIHPPLKYADKRCRKCGAHTHKGCRPKNMLKKSSRQTLAVANARRVLSKCIEDRNIRHLIPPPSVEASPAPPLPVRTVEELPAPGTAPCSILRPPPRNQYRHLSSSPAVSVPTPLASYISLRSTGAATNPSTLATSPNRSAHSPGIDDGEDEGYCLYPGGLREALGSKGREKDSTRTIDPAVWLANKTPSAALFSGETVGESSRRAAMRYPLE